MRAEKQGEFFAKSKKNKPKKRREKDENHVLQPQKTDAKKGEKGQNIDIIVNKSTIKRKVNSKCAIRETSRRAQRHGEK